MAGFCFSPLFRRKRAGRKVRGTQQRSKAGRYHANQCILLGKQIWTTSWTKIRSRQVAKLHGIAASKTANPGVRQSCHSTVEWNISFVCNKPVLGGWGASKVWLERHSPRQCSQTFAPLAFLRAAFLLTSVSPWWIVFCLVLAFVSTAAAEGTRQWKETGYEDFERGTAHGVAIRSTGQLELAPAFKSVYP